MTRLLQNRAVCATLFVLFTLAIVVNTLAGGSLLGMGVGPTLLPETPIERADGPTFPPDPWEPETDKAARTDGPTFPPDPWEPETDKAMRTDGPTLPRNSWEKDKMAAVSTVKGRG